MPAAQRSVRAYKVPDGQLSCSMYLVGAHPDRVKAFARAWDDAYISERWMVCRLAGAPDSFAALPWANVRGDVQCFIAARYFTCMDVLQGFLTRVDEAHE